MSNVTIDEIATLTAKEFGVTVDDMRARHPLGGKRPDRPPALTARYVAVWLARRHTQMSFRRIGAFIDVSRTETVREHAAWVDTTRETNRQLRDAIERIERHIDDIHEARVDAMAGAA